MISAGAERAQTSPSSGFGLILREVPLSRPLLALHVVALVYMLYGVTSFI